MSDPELPQPAVRPSKRARLSPIWLVPLVAALASAILVSRTFLQVGPTIAIRFETAEGLEAHKTEVKFKNVVVGRVKTIGLTPHHQHVVVVVDLSRNAAGLAVEDSKFWVERPRVGLGGISGISTLLSGAYIGVDIGRSKKAQDQFIGLEKPPAVTRDQKGKRFTLHTPDSGSLNIGSPVYFRRIPVGSVAGLELAEGGKGVTLQVFVDSPYDLYVRQRTQFWNASGIDLSVNADGLKLNTQSLATVLAGGVAFESPEDGEPGPVSPEGTVFRLHGDRSRAFARPDGPSIVAKLRFFQSTRGLVKGAPVDFLGFNLGSVKTIKLGYDAEKKEFHADVEAELFVERLGPAYESLEVAGRQAGRGAADMLQELVSHGLRGQLRLGNFLTGQAYIALDFFKDSPPLTVTPEAGVLNIPTESGGLDQLQHQVAAIVKKVDTIPFEDIGKALKRTLRGTSSLVSRLDREVTPEAAKMLQSAQRTLQAVAENVAAPDAPLQQSARATLEQVRRAAYSLRVLSDYLEQHPESLLRGRPAQAEPGANPLLGPTRADPAK
jgi:paraquat-inducible protein B